MISDLILFVGLFSICLLLAGEIFESIKRARVKEQPK